MVDKRERSADSGDSGEPGIPKYSFLLLLTFFGVVYAGTLGSYGMFMWDEAEYASIARSVLNGDGFSIEGRPNGYRLPVVPLSSAVVQGLIDGHSDVVAKLPILAFALLALFVVYCPVALVHGRLSGLFAAGFLGMFPSFWTSTAQLMTEIPYLAFHAGAVAFFCLGLLREQRWLYLSWICLGLAMLTRHNALLFGPTAALLTALALVLDRRRVQSAILSRHFLLAPLAALVIVLPWFIRQQVVIGDALAGIRYAASQIPNYKAGVMPWHFYFTGLPDMVSWPLLLGAVVGAGYALRRRDGLGLSCLVAVLVIVGWMTQYEYKALRLATAILPLLAVVAGIAAGRVIAPFLRQRLGATPALMVAGHAVILVFGLNLYHSHQVLTRSVANGFPAFTKAMSWIRQSTRKSEVLMGPNVAQMGWYSDRRCLDLPGDRGTLAKRLRQTDWVVLVNFERGQPKIAEDLARLVTGDDVANGDVKIFESGQFKTILIRADTIHDRL